ncbi:MAG: hypothetical protein ACI4DY_05015 [Monoglobaceae bacterium]
MSLRVKANALTSNHELSFGIDKAKDAWTINPFFMMSKDGNVGLREKDGVVGWNSLTNSTVKTGYDAGQWYNVGIVFGTDGSVTLYLYGVKIGKADLEADKKAYITYGNSINIVLSAIGTTGNEDFCIDDIYWTTDASRLVAKSDATTVSCVYSR